MPSVDKTDKDCAIRPVSNAEKVVIVQPVGEEAIPFKQRVSVRRGKTERKKKVGQYLNSKPPTKIKMGGAFSGGRGYMEDKGSFSRRGSPAAEARKTGGAIQAKIQSNHGGGRKVFKNSIWGGYKRHRKAMKGRQRANTKASTGRYGNKKSAALRTGGAVLGSKKRKSEYGR